MNLRGMYGCQVYITISEILHRCPRSKACQDLRKIAPALFEGPWVH